MPQPTPKRRMAGPPAPLSMRPQPLAAESTGLKPMQAPVYGADVAPGARQVLTRGKTPALGSADDYEFKERTRQYKDNGAPDVSVSADEEKRPYYNPLTKRLNISPYHGESVQKEYLSELSHSRQHTKSGLLNLALGAARGAMLPDSNQAGGRYATPGTMEYNAHKEIEPALVRQWKEASDKGMKQADQWQQKQSALFTQPAAERGFTPTFEPPMKKRMSAAPAAYADGARSVGGVPPRKKSNQSQADLEMMRNSGANQGAALRQAAPVGNGSYEDFQRTRKSPQGQADKAAYEASNKLGRLTDADYQQRRFNEGTGQVRKMAQANPGSSVFSGAPMDAAYAGQRDRALRLGNYADTGSAAVTAGSLADRSAKMDTQTGYAAPGMALNTPAKDMGTSTPMKKKANPGLPMATYADGAKDMKPEYKKGAKKMMACYADGSKKIKASSMAQDEAANELAEPSRMPTVTAPDMAGDMDTDGSFAARKMRATPKELPADRDASPKKATDYKEAAAVLRSDKALMAKYHEGVASGKAFSMSIGGKTFKYAATASPGAKKTPSASPAGTKAGGKQAADQDFAKSDPENPATAENATPSLRKMGMPGLEDYAGGERLAPAAKPTRSKEQTDQAFRDYVGEDAMSSKPDLRRMGMPGMEDYAGGKKTPSIAPVRKMAAASKPATTTGTGQAKNTRRPTQAL